MKSNIKKLLLERDFPTMDELTADPEDPDDNIIDIANNSKLWTSSDGDIFRPAANAYGKLPPDFYQPGFSTNGIFLSRVGFSTEELLVFEQETINIVLNDIKKFLESEKRFNEFGFPYRRGILLYGPPGGGKTCTIKLIISEIISLGGIGLQFSNPTIFADCTRAVRAVQPDIPIVAIMEDLDAILANYSESDILNILDGVDGFENIVYLATTNYPENLEGRIKNRPSRFDRRYHVGYPNDKARQMYISYLRGKLKDNDEPMDLERWVIDTKGFTPAHMKELFISVHLYGEKYETALDILNEMRKKKISSGKDDDARLGFGS